VQIKGQIDPKAPLEIFQSKSDEIRGLQAVDMFSWGVFRKYERNDNEWYNIFKKKISFETVYLP